RAGYDALIGARGPTDGDGGRGWRAASGDEALGDLRAVHQAHKHDDGLRSADASPVDLIHLMPAYERDGRSMLTVSERDAGIGGRAHRGTHAGNDLEGYVRRSQRLRLFSATAEKKRIAALEAYNTPAGPGVAAHETGYLVLREGMLGGLFAHVGLDAAGPGLVEQCSRGKVVIQNYIGLPDALQTFEGDQLGVAGSRPYQSDRRDPRRFAGFAAAHRVY